jgi:hypothetical protein
MIFSRNFREFFSDFPKLRVSGIATALLTCGPLYYRLYELIQNMAQHFSNSSLTYISGLAYSAILTSVLMFYFYRVVETPSQFLLEK